MCYHLISRVVCRIVIAAAGFSFPAAIPVSATTISLDGTWQAEAVPEARGESIPTAFTRTIPVPGHWPLMKPVPFTISVAAQRKPTPVTTLV